MAAGKIEPAMPKRLEPLALRMFGLIEMGKAVRQITVGRMLAQESDDVVVPVGAVLAQVAQDTGELDGIAKPVRQVMENTKFVGHVNL
jgi:hypothetical protein